MAKKSKEKKEKKEFSNLYKSHQQEKIEHYLKSSEQEGEEEATSKYAKSMRIPYLDLNIFPVDQENLRMIKEEDAKKYGIVLLRRSGKDIRLGVLNPENKETKKFIEKFKKEEKIKIVQYVVSKSSIKRAWDNYKRIRLIDRIDLMKMNLDEQSLSQFEKEVEHLIDLEKRINRVSTTEVLNIIVAGAIKLEASDIHFEPTKDVKIRLRYRIDGVLQDVAEFDGNFYNTVLSRVKMVSGMMINVKDISQDGRFSIQLGKREIDVRVSVLPGNYGEAIVMRLLNQDVSRMKIEKLGIEGLAHKRLVAEIEKKQGMIINSGPTGSGKTTTLYSIINKINTPDKKVITVEDPVEYRLKGIVQTQIEEDRGYTFANGLRAIVRQDPDVILVGEIRDEETAEIAIHSSLTGHLVLTTIHANNSAGVIPRFIDLGIKPSLINSAINICIAQRLVRELCPDCKEKYKPAKETVDVLKKMISVISPKSELEIPKKIDYLWRSKGCPKCRGIGYKGRVGIFEILKITESIKKLIENISSEEEIRRGALEEGMITMEQDGIIKTLKGKTSLEELQRVVGKGDYLMELYESIVIQTLSGGINIDKKVYDKVNDQKKGSISKEALLDASPKDIVKCVLLSGILMDTGDIHIEPGENKYKIRFRIDGVLQDIVSLPMTEFLPLLNEVKTLSGFELQKREGTADGRFSIKLNKEIPGMKTNKIDVRVSIILGGYGDIIVMRLLNQDFDKINLKTIGFREINLKKIEKEMVRPNGMIINTGPTGSGKTTTLYSILKILNKPEVKIITVEDPIEYQMEGLIQTQVNKKEGYTLANAMRSLLRQNPDIIMVGEIRDEETAKIAYQAALTGHLVLTTLHTNSAAGSVQRLINMKLEISDITSGTNAFIAQRLARKLCDKCKKKRKITSEEKEHLQEIFKVSPLSIDLDKIQTDHVYEAVGCSECHNLGYKGRILIAEVLQMNKEMQIFLTKKPTTTEINLEAIKNGMLTMQQDGCLRALAGETTLEEVLRVAGY